MKTYLLREPNPVEPQNARRAPRPGPTRCATARAGLGHRTPAQNGPALFVGLDVHTESIAVSLAPSDSAEVRRYGLIGGTHDDVLKLARKLQAAHPDTELRFSYEAGPHGYPTKLTNPRRAERSSGKETMEQPTEQRADERGEDSVQRPCSASFAVFPNGTSHMIWAARNCDQCVKRFDEDKHTKGRSDCDIENAIAIASATDGTLLHDGMTPMNKADALAKRLNWDGKSYLTHDCPERVL